MPDVTSPLGTSGDVTPEEGAVAGLPQSKTFSKIILPGMDRRKGRTSVAKMS
jgi:hypothetical protein